MYEEIRDQVIGLQIYDNWSKLGVEAPTAIVKHRVLKFTKSLLIDRGITPNHIIPSIEGGIFVCYRSSDDNYTLGVEFFNDDDVAIAVVNDMTFKKVVLVEEISEDNLDNITQKFINLWWHHGKPIW